MQLFLGWARLLNYFELPGHDATREQAIKAVAKVINTYLFSEIPNHMAKFTVGELAGHLRRMLRDDPSLIRELQIAGDLTFLEHAPALAKEKHIWDGVFQSGTNQIFDLMKHYDGELAWELMRDHGFELALSNDATPALDAPILKVMDALYTEEDRNHFCTVVAKASRLPSDLTWSVFLHKNATPELQAVLLDKQSIYNAFTPIRKHSAEYRYVHSQVYEVCLFLGLKGRLPCADDLFARVNKAMKNTGSDQYPWLLLGDQSKLMACLFDMSEHEVDKHFGYILADRFPIQGAFVSGATPTKMAASKAGVAAAIDAYDPAIWNRVIDAEIDRLKFGDNLGLLEIATRRAPGYFMQAFRAQSASLQIDLVNGIVSMLQAHPCSPLEGIASFRLGAGLLQIYRSPFEASGTSLSFEFGHLSTDSVMIDQVSAMLEEMISRDGSEYDVSSFTTENIAFFLACDLLSQEDVRIAMKMRGVVDAVSEKKLPKTVMQKMAPAQRDLLLGRDLGL